jgi:hypothetical protein
MVHMSTERIGPSLRGDERETLRAFLDLHRATLAVKCDGLSTEDARRIEREAETLTRTARRPGREMTVGASCCSGGQVRRGRP